MGTSDWIVVVVVMVTVVAIIIRKVGIVVRRAVVIPPPPPPPLAPEPEPKIFGLRQAMAASRIVGNDDAVAKKLEQFVVEVLGYENTVKADTARQLTTIAADIAVAKETIAKYRDMAYQMEKNSRAHEAAIKEREGDANYAAAIAERFGR